MRAKDDVPQDCVGAPRHVGMHRFPPWPCWRTKQDAGGRRVNVLLAMLLYALGMDEARIENTFEFFDATQSSPAERFERVRWQCGWCDAAASPVATRLDKSYKVAAHFRLAEGTRHAPDCFNHPSVARARTGKRSGNRIETRALLVDAITFPDRSEADAAFSRLSATSPMDRRVDVGRRGSRRSIRAAAYIHRNRLHGAAAPLKVDGIAAGTYWDVFRPVTRAAPDTGAEIRIWFGSMRAFEGIREEADFIEIAFNCRSEQGGDYVRAVADTSDWGDYQRDVLIRHVKDKIALAKDVYRSGRTEATMPTIYLLGSYDRADPCRIVFTDPRKFAIV